MVTVFVNFSLLYSALTLVAGFIVFELYKRYFAGEPDFVMNFDKEEIQDGDDFSKLINKVFEETEKREDDWIYYFVNLIIHDKI